MALAIAIMSDRGGPPPGWHCDQPVGILFVCKNGSEKVTFYGE
jgi:hypothetical protein